MLTVFSYERAKRNVSTGVDMAQFSPVPGESLLERAMSCAKARALADLYEMQVPEGLRLTYLGRVRHSELKQALRTGREPITWASFGTHGTGIRTCKLRF